MSGSRKFRLSRRKNCERKKYTRNCSNHLSSTVRSPIRPLPVSSTPHQPNPSSSRTKPAYRVSRGTRKFRLSQRKNYERKKYQKIECSNPQSSSTTNPMEPQPSSIQSSMEPDPSCEPETALYVTIPCSFFMKKRVTDPCVLLTRLQKVAAINIPNGWSIESDCIWRGCFNIVKMFPYGTLIVTVSRDCQWKVTVNDASIGQPAGLAHFQDKALDTCENVCIVY